MLDAIREGAVLRVRPKAMTVAVIIAGLLPIMYGTGTGADVMRRIAAPMVGGMITVPLLSMFVIAAVNLLPHRPRGLRIVHQVQKRAGHEAARCATARRLSAQLTPGASRLFLLNDRNRAQEDLSTFHLGTQWDAGEYICRESAPHSRGYCVEWQPRNRNVMLLTKPP